MKLHRRVIMTVASSVDWSLWFSQLVLNSLRCQLAMPSTSILINFVALNIILEHGIKPASHGFYCVFHNYLNVKNIQFLTFSHLLSFSSLRSLNGCLRSEFRVPTDHSWLRSPSFLWVWSAASWQIRISIGGVQIFLRAKSGSCRFLYRNRIARSFCHCSVSSS